MAYVPFLCCRWRRGQHFRVIIIVGMIICTGVGAGIIVPLVVKRSSLGRLSALCMYLIDVLLFVDNNNNLFTNNTAATVLGKLCLPLLIQKFDFMRKIIWKIIQTLNY